MRQCYAAVHWFTGLAAPPAATDLQPALCSQPGPRPRGLVPRVPRHVIRVIAIRPHAAAAVPHRRLQEAEELVTITTMSRLLKANGAGCMAVSRDALDWKRWFDGVT